MQKEVTLPIAQALSVMVATTVTTLILAMLTYLLIKVIRKEIYKNKLKKIDLTKYTPLGFGKTGLPAIMQSRKDPNKLIFL